MRGGYTHTGGPCEPSARLVTGTRHVRPGGYSHCGYSAREGTSRLASHSIGPSCTCAHHRSAASAVSFIALPTRRLYSAQWSHEIRRASPKSSRSPSAPPSQGCASGPTLTCLRWDLRPFPRSLGSRRRNVFMYIRSYCIARMPWPACAVPRARAAPLAVINIIFLYPYSTNKLRRLHRHTQ